MQNALVYLPIQCPQCQQTTVVLYTRSEIARLLYSLAPFRLFSACHDVSWAATEEDRKTLLAMIEPLECHVASDRCATSNERPIA